MLKLGGGNVIICLLKHIAIRFKPREILSRENVCVKYCMFMYIDNYPNIQGLNTWNILYRPILFISITKCNFVNKCSK